MLLTEDTVEDSGVCLMRSEKRTLVFLHVGFYVGTDIYIYIHIYIYST